jgi:hypothetical protein
MIVALSTLHIATEEDTAYIARYEIRFSLSIDHETCCRPETLTRAIRSEDLRAQFVQRAAVMKPLPEPSAKL